MAAGPHAVTVAGGNGGSLRLDRAAWACVSLLAGLFFLSIYHQPVGLVLSAVVTALAVCAAVRPYEALLVLAGLGPIATMLLVLARTEVGGMRFVEALTLAFLTGWAARRAVQPRPLAVSPYLRWSATLLIAAALASGIVSGAVMHAEESRNAGAGLLPAFLLSKYLLDTTPVTFAMLLAEGVLLLLIAADTCAGDSRKRDGVLQMMVIGAAAAALFNVLRIVMVAVSRENPWTAFVKYLATLRVSVQYGDLNAAGSYFAMMLLIAVSCVPRARLVAIPGAVLLAAGLWISGSRVALAATCITVAVAGLITLRGRGRRWKALVVGGIAALVVLAAAAKTWYPEGRNVEAPRAVAYRINIARAALKMAAAEPIFGVGLGQFFSLSTEYAGPGVRENAHNNFLQMLAELGVPGLLLFVSVIVCALRNLARAPGPPGPSWGLLAGLAAFLLTALGGHPLLVTAVAYPFWTALGLAAAPASLVPVMNRWARATAIGLMLILAATLPFRMAEAVRHADVEHTSIGFSKWQHEPDGSAYRWAGGRSTFYVASSAHGFRIPLRLGSQAPTTVDVRIFIDGREADRVRLERGLERTPRLVIVKHGDAPYSRIDLEAVDPNALAPLDGQPSDSDGVLRVGRPFIER